MFPLNLNSRVFGRGVVENQRMPFIRDICFNMTRVLARVDPHGHRLAALLLEVVNREEMSIEVSIDPDKRTIQSGLNALDRHEIVIHRVILLVPDGRYLRGAQVPITRPHHDLIEQSSKHGLMRTKIRISGVREGEQTIVWGVPVLVGCPLKQLPIPGVKDQPVVGGVVDQQMMSAGFRLGH